MKIKILLAYDHELPLGGLNTTFDEALFAPTRELMAVANDEGVPVNLFSDVLSAIRLGETGNHDYREAFEHQLTRALVLGHDVQLHLHPHWLETTMQNKRFVHTGKFALADYSGDEKQGDINGIVERGVKYLNKVCGAVKEDYRCVAYRAGGYNLAPKTPEILHALHHQGIRIESSINPGFYYRSALSTIDYQHMPVRSHWTMPLGGPLNAEAEEGLHEIIIAGRPAGFVTNVQHLLRKRKRVLQAVNNGATIHSGKTRLIDKLRFVFSTRMLGFDLHTLDTVDLMKILQYNVHRYGKEDTIWLSTLSHPKNMGSAHRTLMRDFIRAARREYGNDIEFVTYQKAAKILDLV